MTKIFKTFITSLLRIIRQKSLNVLNVFKLK